MNSRFGRFRFLNPISNARQVVLQSIRRKINYMKLCLSIIRKGTGECFYGLHLSLDFLNAFFNAFNGHIYIYMLSK